MSFLPVDPTSVLTGGLDTTATSGAQGGYLDFLYNGAFNVGSGSQSSDATSTPRSGPANSLSSSLGSLFPIIAIGGALWVAAQALK